MPRATNAKPDPDKVYASWTSFSATVDGVDITIHEGQRLRGSVPVVKQCFGQFVQDGLPASEKPTTWEVVAQQDAVAEEAAAAAAKMDVHLAQLPAWFDKPNAVMLREDVRVGYGHSSNASLPVGFETIRAGVLVPADDELVTKRPDLFNELEVQAKKKGRKS